MLMGDFGTPAGVRAVMGGALGSSANPMGAGAGLASPGAAGSGDSCREARGPGHPRPTPGPKSLLPHLFLSDALL